MHKQHTTAAGLSLLLLLIAAPVCLAGEEPSDELVTATGGAARTGWTRLVFTGDDLPSIPTTSLEVTESSMNALSIAGARVPEDTITPFTARDVRLLTVTGQDQPAHTGLRIWFDGETGTVLQRDRLKSGPDGSRKTHRYGHEGAVRVRLEPANHAQEQATPATWTQRKDKVYRYDLDAAGCSRVTVPALLLYAVAIREPAAMDSYLCVFQDDTLYRVWLRAQGTVRIPVDYTVSSSTGIRRVTGEQVVEKTGVRVEPVSEAADTAGFELLELRGEIVIYIDPATRLPVGISGSRGLYRTINIRLSAATVTG
jgi:hypothetical protein